MKTALRGPNRLCKALAAAALFLLSGLARSGEQGFRDLEWSCQLFETAVVLLKMYPDDEEVFTNFFIPQGGSMEYLAAAAVGEALGVNKGGTPETVRRACFELGLVHA